MTGYRSNEQSCELEEYDEQLVRRLIEKVTVFHDKFAVEFKSGVEIDVEGESLEREQKNYIGFLKII